MAGVTIGFKSAASVRSRPMMSIAEPGSGVCATGMTSAVVGM